MTNSWRKKITLWSPDSWSNGIINLPRDNRAVPTVYPLYTSRRGGTLSWLLRYDKIFPSKSLPSNATLLQIPTTPLHLEKINKHCLVQFSFEKTTTILPRRKRKRKKEMETRFSIARTTKRGRGLHLKRIGKSIRSTYLVAYTFINPQLTRMLTSWFTVHDGTMKRRRATS